MQRVVSITLDGNVYQLEERGYNALFAYLDAMETQLKDDPNRAQTLAGVERTVAEKCQACIEPHKAPSPRLRSIGSSRKCRRSSVSRRLERAHNVLAPLQVQRLRPAQARTTKPRRTKPGARATRIGGFTRFGKAG